jgi:dihydroorotate dehydrogenase electron transfer subunit
MRALTATVSRHEPVAGGLTELALEAPALGAALPGQGVALRQPGALAVIPRPYQLATLDARASSAALLYSAGDPLAPWLATLAPGARLDLLGPWGRPFPIDPQARHAVLLGGGTRLVALVALARTLVERGVAVVVLHDAPTAAALLPPLLLPPAVEFHVATADGSAGARGDVLDVLPPFLPWADALYAALPPASYPPLREEVYQGRLRVRRGFATVLAEASLACYTGACGGCAVPLRDESYALLCKDGPAFDLRELR